VSGLIFFIGSIPILLAYLAQGPINKELSVLSMFLLLPTFVGFWLGEKIRNKMSEIVFKKFILVLFLIMGLDLIRRSYLYN
ncbi:MAG: TSUP family transporter, partial [Amylibacter sp.]